MKEFIVKVLTEEKVTTEELAKFIVEYCELCGIVNTTGEQVLMAIQLIQQGLFDLKYACKNCANKIGLQITETLDKNGKILFTQIKEYEFKNTNA